MVRKQCANVHRALATAIRNAQANGPLQFSEQTDCRGRWQSVWDLRADAATTA
jgi:hypothetical protein